MRLSRKEYLSIYYFLQDLFSGTPVKVEDGYPEAILTLPTVSLETRSVDSRNYEMGNKDRIKFRAWYIDVFAQTKMQRDEITDTIIDALEDCIPVYDYDQGFPPTVSPQLGCLDVDTIYANWVKVMPQLTDKLYYRTAIYFTASFTNI